MVAVGGIIAYLKFDDFLAGNENGSFAGKAIGIAVLGLFILVRATELLPNVVFRENFSGDDFGMSCRGFGGCGFEFIS